MIKKLKNKHIMLSISVDILNRLDNLKAPDVSYQECIRQLTEQGIRKMEKEKINERKKTCKIS